MPPWKSCRYPGSTLWSDGTGDLHTSGFWLFELLQVRLLLLRYHENLNSRQRLYFLGIYATILSSFFSNVLHVLDQRCSGRNGCSVKVSDLLDFKDACTEELTSYLQARYTCESGKLNRSMLIYLHNHKRMFCIEYVRQL